MAEYVRYYHHDPDAPGASERHTGESTSGERCRIAKADFLLSPTRRPAPSVPIENSILLKKGKPRQEGTKFVRS